MDVEIVALCRQSLDVDGHPHKSSVHSKFLKDDTYSIVKGECTYKAGSQKCKHVAALLLT